MSCHVLCKHDISQQNLERKSCALSCVRPLHTEPTQCSMHGSHFLPYTEIKTKNVYCMLTFEPTSSRSRPSLKSATTQQKMGVAARYGPVRRISGVSDDLRDVLDQSRTVGWYWMAQFVKLCKHRRFILLNDPIKLLQIRSPSSLLSNSFYHHAIHPAADISSYITSQSTARPAIGQHSPLFSS